MHRAAFAAVLVLMFAPALISLGFESSQPLPHMGRDEGR
jgi:hypothetical protein